ncbi:isoleucyl-tRNA synthetase [Enteropsectra breve]|nr:isoleucyl-tRNA synthetase [Enteropsectra breve]
MFGKNIQFPKAEEEVLKYWQETDAFNKCKELSKDKKDYVFYDGPPFATGLPHYGHILSGTIKDMIGRFMFQQDYRVDRRFGWDCHGLPVEYEIDKSLKITDRAQVLEMGIAKYNDECKSIVMKYSSQWKETVARMGRWADFDNGYKTMDKSFMESTWFIFKQLFNKNLVYRGYKVMPFSTACKTPLSNFEANQNYKDVHDPSVLISFPLLKPIKGLDVELVAWTTTPWTLPANCALIVNKDFVYSIFAHNNRYFVIHEDRQKVYFKDASVVATVTGAELVGCEYRQPFDYFEHLREKKFFRVYSADFVSDSNGTAIVHCAPAFGEEDHKTCIQHGLIEDNGNAPCPVDENGCFTLEPYKGIYIKDLDKIILKDIKDRVLMKESVMHSYPFCWRSDTPLIYKLVPNWFIRVKDAKDRLLKNNELINWVPADIKYKRFHNWLDQCRDWAVGRNRFWGTPIPIWVTEDFSDMICVGSVDELEALTGVRADDLHRQYIDDLVIEKNGKTYRRTEEVLDCWFESGSMPYSQDHWPFTEKDDVKRLQELSLKNEFLSKNRFPADFIGEGIDQTRGWFYTLHVISTLLFDKPAFKNVICFGIVLAHDGKKMSKRLKNYPDPNDVFNKHGADSLRLYLISSPVVVAENLRFSEEGVAEITKNVLLPWYNSLSFFMDCELSNEEQAASHMDEWIMASYRTFCERITNAGLTLQITQVLGHVLKFIDDLSNWYIRINRKQLRANGKMLGELLENFSIIMAPFTPFFSEYCYQSVMKRRNNSDAPQSVHHCMYPKATAATHSFEKTKDVIEAIRHMREKYTLKLKRPLNAVKIVADSQFLESVREYDEMLRSECNILAVEYEKEDKYSFKTTVKPCFEALRKDMATMKEKMKIIAKLGSTEIREICKHGNVAVSGCTISKDDVLIDKSFESEENSKTFGSFGIILDVSENKTIRDMADAREFYSFVQKMRKSFGLIVADIVCVSLENKELADIVSAYYPEILFGASGKNMGSAEFEYNKERISVALFKKD